VKQAKDETMKRRDDSETMLPKRASDRSVPGEANAHVQGTAAEGFGEGRRLQVPREAKVGDFQHELVRRKVGLAAPALHLVRLGRVVRFVEGQRPGQQQVLRLNILRNKS
jgi:hypothetical protein